MPVTVSFRRHARWKTLGEIGVPNAYSNPKLGLPVVDAMYSDLGDDPQRVPRGPRTGISLRVDPWARVPAPGYFGLDDPEAILAHLRAALPVHCFDDYHFPYAQRARWVSHVGERGPAWHGTVFEVPDDGSRRIPPPAERASLYAALLEPEPDSAPSVEALFGNLLAYERCGYFSHFPYAGLPVSAPFRALLRRTHAAHCDPALEFEHFLVLVTQTIRDRSHAHMFHQYTSLMRP